MEGSAGRKPDRRRAGAAAQGPGSTAQALTSEFSLTSIHGPSAACGPPPLRCLISIKSGVGPADGIGAEESVLLAVFADIHANRQAFAACLDMARARGAERMILLGDFVGYGADPEWTVETVMGLVAGSAIAVRGNHDNAVATPSESMNAEAQPAIEWTRGRLSAEQRRFLSELPLALQEDDRLYVHSEASNPQRWRYVQSTPDAPPSMVAAKAPVPFPGHIHKPAFYLMSSTAKMTNFVPASDVPVQLLGGRQWLAVLRSDGPPPEGGSRAPVSRFDTPTRAPPP